MTISQGLHCALRRVSQLLARLQEVMPCAVLGWMDPKDFRWILSWEVGEAQPGSAAVLHSLSLRSGRFAVSPRAV